MMFRAGPPRQWVRLNPCPKCVAGSLLPNRWCLGDYLKRRGTHRRTYVRVRPGEVEYVPGARERKYQIIGERLRGRQQRGGKRG